MGSERFGQWEISWSSVFTNAKVNRSVIAMVVLSGRAFDDVNSALGNKNLSNSRQVRASHTYLCSGNVAVSIYGLFQEVIIEQVDVICDLLKRLSQL